MACAYDGDYPRIVEITVAERVDHQRGVVALQEACRIGGVSEVGCLDVAALDEFYLVLGFSECLVA